MKRGPLLVGGAAGLVAAVIWLPDVRLNRELAAARKEGLWTSGAEARRGMGTTTPEQNAGPLIQVAIKADRAHRMNDKEKAAMFAVRKGTSDSGDRAIVRRALDERRNVLAAWRAASLRPRLDFGRRWEAGYALILPEYGYIRGGVRSLIAAARLGIEPRENLAAAARLAALTRQEPTLIAQIEGVSDGRATLKAAGELKMAREIEPLLGSPPDVRWAVRMEAAAVQDSIGDVLKNPKDYGPSDLRERFLGMSPFATAARVGNLRAWRGAWRDLPKNPTDYATAKRAINRWMPQADNAIMMFPKLGKFVEANPNPGGFVDGFVRFEKERSDVRAGR